MAGGMRQITIVGAGIFGLAAAHAFARRGLAVHLIEAAAIGSGASGGQVGALAPHDPVQWNRKKQIQCDALIAAGDWWAEVTRRGGVDPGWARSGRVMALPAPELAQARIAGAAAHWPAPFALRQGRIKHPLLPAGWQGLSDNLSARIAPRQACAALAAALRAQGVRIDEHAGPRHPDDLPAPCIWTTGAAGLDQLSADLGRPMGRAIKGQSLLLRLPGADLRTAPQLFLDSLHLVAHADGLLALGSTSERDFTDPQATDAGLEALLDRARALLPVLAGAEVVARWAGLRPRAQSRAPLVGPWPGRAGHWIGNGGFKIGLAMAPWVAEALADWILTDTCRVPPDWQPQ